MNKIQALHSFWNSFGLKAYDETDVPDNAELPYITYESMFDDFKSTLYLSASLWYYGTGMTEISTKMLDIESQIGKGGKIVKYNNGAFWIRKGSPFAYRMQDTNDMIRRVILNVIIEFIE